jgi:cytochrome c oxidase subunit 1
VTHSIVPADSQQHDSYYVVAHFHYVLFGGAIFGIFSGIYFWWPKLTGKLLDERIGKWHFWLMLLGFNLAFAPMHFLGLNGMPRRTYRYNEGLGLDLWNLVSTIGAFLIAVSMLVFLWNWWRTARKGTRASGDPWDGRTLEWSIASPTPEYNFARIPTVEAEDDFWHRKYGEDEEGNAVPIATAEEVSDDPEPPAGLHLPSPSYYPALTGAGIFVTLMGLVYLPWGLIPAAVGALVILWGLFGWSMEPIVKEHH